MQNRHAGIGLSVCATIVRVHGARIFATNLDTGGARFAFDLRIEDTENAE